MIILLSPAKTLDYESPNINIGHSVPSLLSKSKILIKDLKSKKTDEIATLMKLSIKLALVYSDRYVSWTGLKFDRGF